MDLFRPYLAGCGRKSAFASETYRPREVFMLSLAHLRSLVDEYTTSYAGRLEAYTIAWVHGPMYLAPATLRYDRDEGWDERFVRCIESCRDLFNAHAALEDLLRALLGMAISIGVFTLVEAVELLDDLRAKQHYSSWPPMPQAGFVVDHDLAMHDVKSAIGSILAREFDNKLFQESQFNSAI